MTMQNSIFQDIFETDPLGRRALFQSTLPTTANPFQQQLFGQLYEPTFNQYLGQLGAQVKAGQTPALTFNDYLKNSFNPQRELLKLPEFGQGGGFGPTLFNFH